MACVSRYTGIPVADLSMENRLLQDLGVDGDDASEILTGLADKYGVDFSEFIFERRFRWEPTLLSVLKLPSTRRREFAEKIPVRICDLVAAVRSKRWT